MALEARELHVEPALPLPVRDDADVDAFGLEDRPLLDMQLKEGFERALADGLPPDIADPLQLLAEELSFRVLQPIGVILAIDAGEDARRDHGRRVARALLVGPVHHLDRMLRLDAEVVQRAHDLEPGEHAEHAVIFAAGRLRVEVAADHHRRKLRVRAFAAGEHVAHRVDGELAAGLLNPRLEEVAAFPVDVGQRQAAVAAFHARADLRHLHEAVP